MCCNTDCFAKYINMYCTCTVLRLPLCYTSHVHMCSLNGSLLLLKLWLICTCTHACILMLYAIILYQNYWGNTNSVVLCLAKDTTDTVSWTDWVCDVGTLSHTATSPTCAGCLILHQHVSGGTGALKGTFTVETATGALLSSRSEALVHIWAGEGDRSHMTSPIQS